MSSSLVTDFFLVLPRVAFRLGSLDFESGELDSRACDVARLGLRLLFLDEFEEDDFLFFGRLESSKESSSLPKRFSSSFATLLLVFSRRFGRSMSRESFGLDLSLFSNSKSRSPMVMGPGDFALSRARRRRFLASIPLRIIHTTMTTPRIAPPAGFQPYLKMSMINSFISEEKSSTKVDVRESLLP